jgi:hypothetical protein
MTMKIVMPDQLTKLVTPVNPLAAEADRHTVAWAQQHRLVTTPSGFRRMAATGPGSLAAHCYPPASQEDLFLLADWISWLFVLDDQNDEGCYSRSPEALQSLLTQVFFGAVELNDRALDNPLVAALKDILDRIGDRMSAEWRHRFLRHLVDCFTANVWQAAHRHTDDIPDLDTFPAMRRDTGAVPPTFDLIEFVESTTIPAVLYYNRVYQRLITSAANVVCWTNDLMTLEKEFAHGDEQNLVSVLGHALQIPLTDSVDEVAALAGREVEVFLSAEAELDRVFDELAVSDDLRAATLNCVDMLRAWMRGHIEWGRVTVRYLEPTR